jgi:hypothetical protein
MYGGMDRAEFLGAVAALATGVVIGCESDPEGDTSSGAGTSGSGAGTTTGNGTSTSSASGGGGSSSTASGSGGGQSGSCRMAIDAQITCRHDHSMIIPAEDIEAGMPKTYDIQGTNPTHGHDVTVTAEMFAQLIAGETVEIFVPSQNQPHTVFISCAGLDPHALDDQECN